MNDKDLARFLSKIEEVEGPLPTPCWRWLGGKCRNGYGNFHVQGRMKKAHRASYEHFVGPIPADKELDHLCRVRDCANYAHVEPVTHTENIRRGDYTNLKKSKCRNGHDLSGPNLVVVSTTGARCCRECSNTRKRNRYKSDSQFKDYKRQHSRDYWQKKYPPREVTGRGRRLTEEQKQQVKQLYLTENITKAELSRRFQVSKSWMSSLLKGV